MTATYLGSLTIGAVLPGAVSLGLAGAAGINLAMPNLQDQLKSLLAVKPAPVSFAAQITTLQAMIKGIEASASLGLAPPSVAMQIAAIAKLVAALQAQLGSLTAQLAVIESFGNALAAGGVHAVAFEGQAAGFAAEVGALLGTAPVLSPTDAARGIALVTTSGATWTAMRSIFRVSA